MENTMNKKMLLVSSLAIFGLLAACGHQESSNSSSASDDFSRTSSEVQHNYSDSYTYDEEYHWKKCTVSGHTDFSEKSAHNFDGGVETKPSTETETGIKTYTCLTCSYKKEEILPKLEHVHTFDTEHWKQNETHHWHEATCVHTDEKDSYSEHNFGTEPTIDEPSTYTEEGLQHYTCLTCAYEKSETIPMLEKKDPLLSLTIGQGLKDTYNGKSISTFINASSFRCSAGTVTVTYRKTTESIWHTVEDAPKDVGTYIVKAAIEEGDDYKASSMEVSFVLEQRVLGEGLNLDKVYDGTSTKTISNIKEDGAADALTSYGAVEGDDINVNVDYGYSYVTAQASFSKGNITLSGADSANYKLVLDKDTYTISTKRTLTLPSSLKNGQFTRSALDRQYNAIYHFTEEDGVLPGDDVYLYDDATQDNEFWKIGTHEFSYEHLHITSSNYSFDIPEEWEDMTLTLTVLNDETLRIIQQSSTTSTTSNIIYTGYVQAGQVSVGDTVYFSHVVKSAQVEKIEDSDGNSIEKAGRFEYDTVKIYLTSPEGLFASLFKMNMISIWGDEESAKSISQFDATIKNVSTNEYKIGTTPRLFFAPDLTAAYSSGNNSFVDLSYKGMLVNTAEIIEIIDSDHKTVSSILPGEEMTIKFEFYTSNAYPVKKGDELVQFLAANSGKVSLKGVVTSIHTHVDKYYKTGYCDEEIDGGCGHEVTRGTFSVSDDEKTYTISETLGTGVKDIKCGQYGFYEITLPEGKLFRFNLVNKDEEDVTDNNYHAMYNEDGSDCYTKTISVETLPGKYKSYRGYTGPNKIIVVLHPDVALYNFQMTFTQIYPV